jgi:serine/threonine-protein kinase mTOR
VQTSALPYLDHDNPLVRLQAAKTCTKLFVQDPICHHTSTHAIEIVGDVLDKLLTVGIADPGSYEGFAGENDLCANLSMRRHVDPTIRYTVLQNLNERFDRHLAQAENVRSLFIALNDESFVNRELAIGIIGRLAVHNPAYVMPSLRKALIQLITELEYSTAA